MAAKQRSIVQGRITNGTLFPNISAKIQASMDRLVRKSFGDLYDAVNTVLDLIGTDVEMALAFDPQSLGNAGNQQDPEEERQKTKLLAEIVEFKRKHAELLAAISDIPLRR